MRRTRGVTCSHGLESTALPRFWRALTLLVLISCGAPIAARAWLGPFWIVHSPMNLEGVAAIAFLAGLAWLRRSAARESTRRPLVWDAVCVLGLVVIVLGVFWKSLWFPLVSDDYILVTRTAHASGPLFKLFFTPGGDGSYRPVGYLLLISSGRWAGVEAFRWHAISLALHAANAVLVYMAARLATKRIDIALPAALIFALHGTRPEAVTWTAGRFDVLAGFFALAALVVFLRYYEVGSPVYAIGSGLLVVVAIMCKESAYGFPALAAAFGFASGRLRWRRLATTLVVPAAMLVYRFILFRGPGGYVDPQTGHAQILSVRFLPVLKALFLRFWAVLLFPIDWAQKPEFYLAASLTLMVGCLVVVLRWGRGTRMLVLAGCTMLTAFPAVHLLAIGSDLLGERVLYLPAAVFALFLAVLVASIDKPVLARAAAVCVVIFYGASLVHNLGIWDRVSALADRTCSAATPELEGAEDAAILGIPVAIAGVNFFANGFAECVALHAQTPPRNWTITHLAGSEPRNVGGRVLVWDETSQTLREK